MINIVTFLWASGTREWDQDGWGPTYVDRLFRGVWRHSMPLEPEAITFTVFTDRFWPNWDKIMRRINTFWGKVPIRVLPLVAPTMQGCLPKITAFNPGHDFQDRVIVFDLDNVIVGNLADMFAYDGDFCVRDGFRRQGPDGDMISFNPQSQIADTLWHVFAGNAEKIATVTRGRERMFYRKIVKKPDLWQNIIPDQIVSYKRHCRKQKSPPPNARVVSFHGRPRPHEVAEQWVKHQWA